VASALTDLHVANTISQAVVLGSLADKRLLEL